MTSNPNLHLYEEILLLALKDKTGSTHFGINYQFALAGAVVAELLLAKKISIQHEKKKKFVVATTTKTMGDPILDEALAKLRKARRREQVRTWVHRIANLPRLKNKAAESLVRKGVLRLEESKVLLIFTRRLYPEINPKPERALLSRMEDAIFTDKQELDPHTLVLISICESTGMLKPLFDRKKLKARKGRIKEIVSGNLVGQATKEAVEAMQAAVMVATIIPAVTVAATS